MLLPKSFEGLGSAAILGTRGSASGKLDRAQCGAGGNAKMPGVRSGVRDAIHRLQHFVGGRQFGEMARHGGVRWHVTVLGVDNRPQNEADESNRGMNSHIIRLHQNSERQANRLSLRRSRPAAISGIWPRIGILRPTFP